MNLGETGRPRLPGGCLIDRGLAGCDGGFRRESAVPDCLRLPFLVLSLATLVATGCSRQRPAQSWRALFNGRDLSGFYTWLQDTRYEDPRHVFAVSNGVLRISGDGLGYLATDKTYANYELELEYRWGSTNTHWGDRLGRARDGGVFLHAVGPDGNSHDGGGAFMAAIECNVFEGATGDFLLIRGDAVSGQLIAPRLTVNTRPNRDAENWPWWEPSGEPLELVRWGRVNWRHKAPGWTDVTGFRGPADVEHPVGQWNQLRLSCVDDTIEVRLNGQLVNRATRVFPRAGKILLQREGSEWLIRRMAIRPLNR